MARSRGGYGRELALAVKLVEEAGALLVAEAKRATPRGRSASKLEVDEEIEAVLVAGLLRAFPDDGVHAEEKNQRAGTSGRRWVIDPHDGTSDFSAGARETSISLALEDCGALVLGVVHAPCVASVKDRELRSILGDDPLLITWAQGEPVRRNGAAVDAGPAPTALARGAVALVSRKVAGEKLQKNRDALAPAKVVPCASIATRLALAACGAVEVAYTLSNPLAAWDYAGGQALLQGAGGVLLDARGESVGPGHDGRGYVGARSEALASLVLERLREALPKLLPPRSSPGPASGRAPKAPPAAKAGPAPSDAPGDPEARVRAAGGRVDADREGAGRLVLKLPPEREALARELHAELGGELRRGGRYLILFAPARRGAPATASREPELVDEGPASQAAPPAKARSGRPKKAKAGTEGGAKAGTDGGGRSPAPVASVPSTGAGTSSLAGLIDLERGRRRSTGAAGRRSKADVGALLAEVEAEVAADPAGCFTFDPQGRATLTTRAGSWSAGRFETPTIGELEARVAKLPGSPGAQVTLSVLHGVDASTDIGALQAADDGRSLFQAASQFNCLESPGPHVTTVASYVTDPTQGPRASVSAFPGTFLRHYRAPRRDGQAFVQGADGELDLLADALGPTATVVHGYLRTQDVVHPAKAAARLEEQLHLVRVGLHDEVEVVLGEGWGGPVDGAPRIAQVFTSTMALAYSATPASAHHLAMCRSLLRGAYLGTLLGAVALGKRRAVLTLIGGGVFGNPMPAIWDAILWATDRVAKLAPAPLDVIVNSREGLVASVGHGGLLEAARARGGVVIEASSQELRVCR